MSETLLAHRFRVHSSLFDGDGVALHAVRDAATERSGWLLHVRAPGMIEMELAIRHRLIDFAPLAICRSYELIDVVRDGGELFLLLEPAAGELRAFDPKLCPQAALGALRHSLREHAESRRWAGRLEVDQLRLDEHGEPLLLPSAYALPPAAQSREPSRFADRPRHAGWIEADALCAALALPALEEVPEQERHPDARRLLAAYADAERGSCVVEIADDVAAQTLTHGVLAELGERFQRAVFTLGPHVRAVHSNRRRGDQRPALVILDAFSSYEAFAEAFHALRKAGWIDGRESYLVLRQRAAASSATGLWFYSLRQQAQERYLELHCEPVPLVEPVVPERAHVLELLSVARHALSARFVARALSMDADTLLRALHDLRDRDLIELGHGIADTGSSSVELLVFVVPGREIEVAASRREELRSLMAAALESLGGRATLGRQWLQFEHYGAVNPKKALPLARRLIERADRAGMALLSYAVHERILEQAEALKSSLADRCRAAIAMGDQHRERGELDRAEAIFDRALEELSSVRGREAAALASDLTLILVQLRMHQARWEECDSLLRDAIERFRDQLDAPRRGRLYLRHADVLYSLGRFVDAKQRGELARKLLDPQSHPSELAMAYNRLALTLWQQSDYEDALANMQRSLVLWQQVGDELWASRLYNNMSLVQRAMGRLLEAEESLQRAMELKQKVGDLKGLAAAQLNMGFLAIEQERFDEAMDRARQCLEQAHGLQQGELEAQAHGLWGEAAMNAGEFALAREQYERDLELSQKHKMRNEAVATLRRLVDLLLRMDDLDAAAERLEEARQALPLAGSRFESAMLDLLEARLLRACGALEAALDLFGSAARVFSQLRRIDLQVVALSERGRLHVFRGQRAAAQRSLAEARDLVAAHELVSSPRSLTELETELASSQAELGAGSATLSRLADLMSQELQDEDRVLESAMQWLQDQLQVDQVLWLDGRSGRIRAEPAGRPLPPAAALEALRQAARSEAGSTEDPAWRARACGPIGVLAIHRRRDWSSEDLDLVRLLCSALGLMLLRPEQRAEVRAGESVELRGDRFGIIGQSPAMRDVLRQIELVRDHEMSLLLLGENGTGKDMVARAIHECGHRREASFHAINCAAIPASLLESELFGHERGSFTGAHERHRGVFERADGGTLFLDEIGEMPLEMQAKLLRVLQNQVFQRVGGSEELHSDVRVIAATNRDLRQMVDDGIFRMDLYFRLNVISISIPPLRERGEDIGLLARHFIERFASEFRTRVTGISQEAVGRLMEYPWPGNVRELENVLKNAMVFAESSRIRVEDLPSQILSARSGRGGQSVEEAVRAMVVEDQLSEERPLMPRLELLLAVEMVRAVGNKTRAAKLLGITKPTLYDRLRRFRALYGRGAVAGG